MKPEPKLARDLDLAGYLCRLPPDLRAQAVALLGEEEGDALDRDWASFAHTGQIAPQTAPNGGPWSTWVLKAGRGFGKTLAGAQWVTQKIADGPADLRIALVGATLDDTRRVMVEGRSGLIHVAGAWLTEWRPSLRRPTFRTGAEATLFSGASPEALRGPEHHIAWCDELAKWEKPQESWDMLQLGLRLGDRPRALITTTPRPGPVLSAIMAEEGTVTTGGPTRANPHISRAYQRRVAALYEGTRLGRQELDGELLPDAAGALWSVELLARCRVQNPPRDGEGDHPKDGGGGMPLTVPQEENPLRRFAPPPHEWGGFHRTLIAVDPPVGDGTCGIVAVARSGEGQAAIAHVLADHSVTARSPEGWANAVASAAAAHGTTDVIAEANQGGKLVKSILLTADPDLHVRLVHASVGKVTRAEPVAHLFEAGKVVLHGRFDALEAQLMGMIAGGGYEGPGRSPDRADAMVWGVAEAMRGRGEARITLA